MESLQYEYPLLITPSSQKLLIKFEISPLKDISRKRLEWDQTPEMHGEDNISKTNYIAKIV